MDVRKLFITHRRWLYVGLILVVGLTTTYALWRKLAADQVASVAQMTESEMYHVQTELMSRLQSRTERLEQIGRRWALEGAFDEKAWRKELQLQREDLSSYESLVWVDRGRESRWVWERGPETERPSALSASIPGNPPSAADRTRLRTTTEIFPGRAGLFAHSPVFVEGRLRGLIVGVFDLPKLFGAIIPWESTSDFGIVLSAESQPLYANGSISAVGADQPVVTRHFSLLGVPWEIRVWPTVATVEKATTDLPLVVLILGSVVTLLLGLAYYYGSIANKRQAQLAQLNERIERDLRQSRKKYSIVFEHGALPIILFKLPEKTISDVNRAWLDLFGYSREEVIGKRLSDIGLSPVRPCHIAEGEFQTITDKLRLRSGEERLVSAHMSRAEIDGDSYLIATLDDITLQNAAEEKLVAAKEAAEQASDDKSSFLATMSHELRTPLGAMLGFTNLLRDPALNEVSRSRYLDILSTNGQQLTRIIDDILDLSKVESGHLLLEWMPTDPSDLARGVAALLAIKAKEKGIRLDLEVAPGLPRQIVTDPHRLKQVLLNVVGNAVKFTAKGGVTIRVRPTAVRGSAPNGIEFDVEDTGIGIDESHRERIFEMFVQADSSIDRKYGGTGLGLSLSRKLARSLGGDLALKRSEPGRGSLFTITVANFADRATTSTPTALPVAFDPNRESHLLDGLHILVVDDSPDNRELIQILLSRQGAVVDLAENGKEGYRAAMKGQHDVVIMDVQMPVMDGCTATQELRRHGYRKPVIALTAHAMEEVRTRCLRAGCNGHLSKPIDPLELFTQMSQYAGPHN